MRLRQNLRLTAAALSGIIKTLSRSGQRANDRMAARAGSGCGRRRMQESPSGMASASQADSGGFDSRFLLQTEDKGASCALSSCPGFGRLRLSKLPRPHIGKNTTATLLLGLVGSIFIRETRIADKGASCALSSCPGFGRLCLSKFPRIGKDAVGGPSFFIYFCPWGLTGCPQPSKIEGGGDYDLCDGRYPSDRP